MQAIHVAGECCADPTIARGKRFAGLGPSRVPPKPLGEGRVRGVTSPCHEGLLGFERPAKFGFNRQKDRLRVSFRLDCPRATLLDLKPAPAASAGRWIIRLLGMRRARVTLRRHCVSGGNGVKPICSPAHPGCWIVAPLWPQAVQRTHCRSLSLDVLAPHRMTGTAHASGA